MYQNPNNQTQNPGGQPVVSPEEEQKHFDLFFEDVFIECEDSYGPIEEMNICDNLGDHLVGNIYIKFRYEEDAEKAVQQLNNRWFNGLPIHAELSPVTDFREACCRQYEMGECTRGGFCNFMHLKPVSRDVKRFVYGHRSRYIRGGRHNQEKSPSHSRSPSPGPRRHQRRGGRSRSRSRSPAPRRK